MKKQVLFIVLMLMPLMASASTKINGIYYNLNSTDKVAEVTRVPSGTSKYTGSVVIPETVYYDEITYSVTSIGDWAFFDCQELTSVTIPSSVISIGVNSFSFCSNLTSVIIPNGVTTIGKSAFMNCYSLTSIIIPNNVTSIEEYAFAYCYDLASVSIGNGISYIEHGIFFECNKLTSVKIGNNVRSISNYNFENSSTLRDVYCYANPAQNISATFPLNSSVVLTLHVPLASIESYKTTSPWKEFGMIVPLSTYKLTYLIDGMEYKSYEIEEGEDIVPEDEPTKDNYTFSGWSEIPSVMPTHDVTITGSFTSNLPKCATPTITLLANGKVKVESATEGATCITNITASNAEPLTDGEISLTTPLTVYTVTSYATAEGYEDSDVATATFRYEKAEGDVNGDGVVNISDVVQLVNMILGK